MLSTRRRIIVIKTNLIIFNWWSRSFEIVFRYYKIDVTFGIILQNLKWYLDNNIVDIRYQNSYNISGIILTYRYLSCYLYNKRQKKEKSAKNETKFWLDKLRHDHYFWNLLASQISIFSEISSRIVFWFIHITIYNICSIWKWNKNSFTPLLEFIYRIST